MWRYLIAVGIYGFLLLSFVSSGAEKDQWTKLRDLAGGTELRVYKHGARQPLLVKMDEATADSLVVVLKNEQISIPKDQIDRVDYRPSTGRRVIKESKTSTSDPNTKVTSPNHPDAANVPGSSSSNNVTFQGKPDFETIYRK